VLVPLTRRRLFARALAALLAGAGLRPAPAPAAPAPACPHPLHLPLCADRPGPGLWFHTYLRLACPLCQETVHQRGYLPEAAYATAHAAVPPERAARALPDTSTYSYASCPGEGPQGPRSLPDSLSTYSYSSDLRRR
jgi:hypothetical protein